ncbi:hypothetical protein M9H77_25146 [Catharanthus roseus]|uniref:Uncharacterized protein n=1 Tax=Catharanthus roseus TaxID=4058 RepID=A0ACC0A635_CATRO|nr:hypothetical protein M9H77_25146 [Catharanthus roseus]
MVRPGARRGDDDLSPMTDRTGRVKGRTITMSSYGVRRCHSTSDISSTPALIGLGMYYDSNRTQYFSKTQIPLNEVSSPGLQLGAQFFEQLVASVLMDSFYSGADYGATDCGIPLSDAGLGRDSGEMHIEVAFPLRDFDWLVPCLDILVFPYVCYSGETGCEVVQTVHPEIILFVLWSNAGQQITGLPYHLLMETWTSVLAVPPSWCTDDYILWFLPHSHPRIQNPETLSRGVQLPSATPISLQVLVDMISHEVDRDDVDSYTNIG